MLRLVRDGERLRAPDLRLRARAAPRHMARAALRPELVSAFFVQELPDLARTRLIFKRPKAA
jgi:hypothetical protein